MCQAGKNGSFYPSLKYIGGSNCSTVDTTLGTPGPPTKREENPTTPDPTREKYAACTRPTNRKMQPHMRSSETKEEKTPRKEIETPLEHASRKDKNEHQVQRTKPTKHKGNEHPLAGHTAASLQTPLPSGFLAWEQATLTDY